MFYKNFVVFQLLDKTPISDIDAVFNLFKDKLFTPCLPSSESSCGWVSPYGESSEDYCPIISDCLLFCLKVETKILPGSVINEKLIEVIKNKEEAEERKIGRKERTELKDEIVFECLPKAFSKISRIHGYIDLARNFIVIDSSSLKVAEDVITFLRKTLGSIPCVPILTNDSPDRMLTALVLSPEAQVFSLGDSCEIQLQDESDGVVKCKNIDLSSEEVTNHINAGGLVTKLEISWEDRLSVVVDKNLQFKKLKFSDLLTSDHESSFEADFELMHRTLAEFIDYLVYQFGGLVKPAE